MMIVSSLSVSQKFHSELTFRCFHPNCPVKGWQQYSTPRGICRGCGSPLMGSSSAEIARRVLGRAVANTPLTIKQRRQAVGMRQEVLAALAGVSRSSLSRLESGSMELQPRMRKQIESAFDLHSAGIGSVGKAWPDMILSNVGVLVRQERRSRGWTMRHLAEASSLRYHVITAIEESKNVPSPAVLARLATVFGLPFADFLKPLARTGVLTNC